MKTNIIIIALLFLTSFSSCQGQTNQQQKNQLPLGKKVLELDPDIWRIFQDSKNHYWFGSNGRGMYHFDGEQLRQFTREDGLINDTIRGIQEDALGNIFIETPRGISKYDGASFSTLNPIRSPYNKWILLPTDLWFGYDADDIYRYDGKFLYQLQLPRQDLDAAFATKANGVHFKDLKYNPYGVYGINKDSKGNVWIGTLMAGAFRYDGASFLWFPEKELSVLPDGRAPAVRSILEDKNGFFWLSNILNKYKIVENGKNTSYVKLAGHDKTSQQFNIALRYFNSGVRDAQGNLWMTTYGGGVWKYNGEQFYNFPLTNGDSEVLLISISIDKQGTFWLGTDNMGVYKFDGERFEKFELLKK